MANVTIHGLSGYNIPTNYPSISDELAIFDTSSTTTKKITIDEIFKQTTIDGNNGLSTTNKTIVGGINELKGKTDVLEGGLFRIQLYSFEYQVNPTAVLEIEAGENGFNFYTSQELGGYTPIGLLRIDPGDVNERIVIEQFDINATDSDIALTLRNMAYNEQVQGTAYIEILYCKTNLVN